MRRPVIDCGGMTDSEALARHKAIVEYESNYKDVTAKYERMYGPLSDEERLGWRRCYVALVRVEGSPPTVERMRPPVP